jgi:peptide/nickel transport system ATP-binding protein
MKHNKMNDRNTIMEVTDLGIAFNTGRGRQEAVKKISFEIQPGKTLAIVGESGSGKSVSSLSLMSLLSEKNTVFTSGIFNFNHEVFKEFNFTSNNILPTDPQLKKLRGKGIAMIFQEPMTSLNPVMTCGVQVEEMIRQHQKISREKAQQKAIELFEEVKLPRAKEIYFQYPHQLSGGQRQRVMIAMAISCNPSLLIADEPTTALDVTVQKEILLLLKNLQHKHGMAMIFITHDLGVVAEIADDIIVMKKGEVVEKGSAIEILQNPQHTYTRGLLACRPDASKKNIPLLTVSDFTEGVQNNSSKVGAVSLENTDVNPILRINDLSKNYSATKGIFKRSENVVRAVKKVSFEIYRGETLGLVGESGCGKTTLSRMLLGLIPATSGNILYQESAESQSIDLVTLSNSELRKLRKDIQIIFQDPYSSLDPKQNVGSAIIEPMEVFGLHQSHNKRTDKAIELLNKVGLGEEHLTRYPHEFSGGQRQRIVIARALACEPKFVICDESVSALDVSIQAQVLNLLNELKRDYSLTYLFISHDLNVVYYMSDRIMVMNKGAIEEIGIADDVFYRPKSPYTSTLLNAIPGNNLFANKI